MKIRIYSGEKVKREKGEKKSGRMRTKQKDGIEVSGSTLAI